VFAHWLKFLRALIGACALMLFIGGGFFVGAEPVRGEGGESAWGSRKGAKPAIVGVVRGVWSCPLAAAAKTVGGRVSALTPVELFLAWSVKPRSGASAHGWRREPEREPGGRVRPGVVRLLI
jgi:hypothetical protein